MNSQNFSVLGDETQAPFVTSYQYKHLSELLKRLHCVIYDEGYFGLCSMPLSLAYMLCLCIIVYNLLFGRKISKIHIQS